jgi:hypothetical protein
MDHVISRKSFFIRKINSKICRKMLYICNTSNQKRPDYFEISNVIQDIILGKNIMLKASDKDLFFISLLIYVIV